VPLAELAGSHYDLLTRLMSFMTTFGYLMSNYKDPGRPYAVILAEDTASDKDGGGAGKDLSMKMISKVRGVSFMPGKTWSANANFAFQTYRLGDDVLYIGDIDRRFNMEILHNTISEGLTIERKHKAAMTL